MHEKVENLLSLVLVLKAFSDFFSWTDVSIWVGKMLLNWCLQLSR